MPPQQLHLFDPAKPLLERFGAAFFKAVPPRPGIYIMSGEGDRVLYIGQSANLRQRLGSYKNARPDRVPRKIIRLVHSVRTLVWEECESPQAARLKETQLLRVHRPRFNVQNVYPRAYRFISGERRGDGLRLGIGTEPKADGRCFGAFKGGAERAFGSLLRLLWAMIHQTRSPHDFPAPLLRATAPREFDISPVAGTAGSKLGGLESGLDEFLGGSSAALIEHLASAIPGDPEMCVFQRNLLAGDVELLAGFYEHGPRRNEELRIRNGLKNSLIGQEQLDELVAAGKPGSKLAL